MQNRVIRLDVYARGEEDVSSIRRRPRIDDRKLAKAIDALHKKGPGIVCELWAEVEALKAKVAQMESVQVEAPASEASELVKSLRDSD